MKTLPTPFLVFFPQPSESETKQSNRGKRGKNKKPGTEMLGENVQNLGKRRKDRQTAYPFSVPLKGG